MGSWSGITPFDSLRHTELTEIILGIVGKAQDMDGMAIHAFVVLSTHAYFLLSSTGAD